MCFFMKMRLATMEDRAIFDDMYTNFFVDDKSSHKIAALSEERYQQLVDGEAIYLAIIDGKVMGFATLFAYENEGCEIESLYIKEKSRGYGTQFYNLLEKEIRDSNIKRVFVRIFDVVDCRAENFFWRRGFCSVKGSGELEKLLK